jgi:CTP:phosphocholine cytidylyltransferase-like protein
MNQLADELKEIVGNYTDDFAFLKNKDEVRLFINEIPSPLMYDILVVSKSLNYGFIIKQALYLNRLDLNIKIEFYKTL